MNEQSLISVIIPVYNVEQYLTQCLDSIINQTYSNLEIVCVDDGSTDTSGEICEKYSLQDNRVKVIHKKNGGLSDTRNVGIENSRGEFLMFIDSDDWIDRDCIEILKTFQEKNTLDMLFFTYVKEYNGKSVEVHPYEYSIEHDEESVLTKRLFGLLGQELKNPEMADSLCSACMKLYRSDIVKNSNVRFVSTKEIGSYEDGLFNLQICSEMPRIGYLNKSLYHYRKTNNTSLTSMYKPKLVEQWQHLFLIIEAEIDEKNYGEEYRLRLGNRVALSLIGIGLNEICADHSEIKKIKNIKTYISSKKYKKAIGALEIYHLPFKWKVFFILAKIRLSCVVYLLLSIMMKLRKRGIG